MVKQKMSNNNSNNQLELQRLFHSKRTSRHPCKIPSSIGEEKNWKYSANSKKNKEIPFFADHEETDCNGNEWMDDWHSHEKCNQFNMNNWNCGIFTIKFCIYKFNLIDLILGIHADAAQSPRHCVLIKNWQILWSPWDLPKKKTRYPFGTFHFSLVIKNIEKK